LKTLNIYLFNLGDGSKAIGHAMNGMARLCATQERKWEDRVFYEGM
jgi:hypothetical protein